MVLRVVDISENSQITDVALGQNLELQIILTPVDSVYDFRAVQLIARSNTGHSSILLLDNRGCATDLSVFPQLQRRTTNTSQVLFGRFHAFKFAGSRYVNFEVVIQFCLHKCQVPKCGPYSKDIRKRRRRHAIDVHQVESTIKYGEPITVFGGATQRPIASSPVYDSKQALHNLTEHNQIQVQSREAISQRVLGRIAEDIVAADVTETTRTAFTANRRVLNQLDEVPLQFQLTVRVPDSTNSESLIYGESNSVFTAGNGIVYILFTILYCISV